MKIVLKLGVFILVMGYCRVENKFFLVEGIGEKCISMDIKCFFFLERGIL